AWDRSCWIDDIDAYRGTSAFFGLKAYRVAIAACVDRIQHQIQKCLLDLSCVEVPFQLTGSKNIDCDTFVRCVSTGDSGNVVQHVRDVCSTDLGRAWTGVDQEIAREPLKAGGFLLRDREHLLT